MDTPGSSVNRKFQANLDLKKSPSGEREFKLDAQCPFNQISTSGSYTWKSNLVQCSLNVVADKSQRYSVKAVMEMSRTSSEMTLKPTLQWTLPASEPVSVSGSIVYSSSRKQHIMIDLRSNKPRTKPYVLTGNLMKDGSLGISKRDEWKMSADLVAKTPFLTTKMHSIVDKHAGQTQGVTSSISVDYETQRSRKQSVKLSSKIQQSSSKISASAKFETTQSPKCSWALSWDMQGSPKTEMKNEIMLGYGRNPERTFISISQTFQLANRNSLSEGSIALKAPQFSIDSELSAALGLHMRETGTFHIESDLRYKKDSHIKCLVQLKELAKKPVKMAVKAQLEYPGRKLMYKDEIEEIHANVFQGRSILQWQANQQASLQYTYKKLSQHSIFHHEIESTLNAPFLRSQIVNQASVKVTKENLDFHAQVQTGRESSYKVDAQLKKRGQSQVSISAPIVEGEIEISNESEKKSTKINVLLKKHNPRRIVALAAVDLSSKKSVEAEVLWNADRRPSDKVSFSAEFEAIAKRSRKAYSASSKVQILDLVAVDASLSGEKGSQCTLQCKVDVSGRDFQRVVLSIGQEMSRENIHSIISYQQGQSQKAVVELNGKYAKQSKGCEIQATASIKSPDHSFEDKELSFRHSLEHSRSSVNAQCNIRFENAPGKTHEATIELSSEARLSKKMRIAISTPYQQFSHQEINFSHRREQDRQTVNAAVKYSRKEIALSSVLTKTNKAARITCSLKTPFITARDVTVFAAFENQRSQKQVESRLELNGQKKFEASGSYMSEHGEQKAQTSAKLFLASELAISAKYENSKNSLSQEFSMTKDSSRLMSYKVSHRSTGDEFVSQLEAASNKQTIVDVKLIKEAKGSDKYILKVNKPFTPISIIVQSTKSDENSNNLMISACRESSERLCYNIKGYYKRESNSQRFNRYRKITLDVEKETGRNSAMPVCNVHFLLSQQGHAIKSRFLIETKEKKYGYELAMQKRSHEDKPCELDVSIVMPARTIRSTISATHNAQRSALELVLIPSTSENEKIVVEMKRDWNSRNNELSGLLKLSHPSLQSPISAKYGVSKEQAQWPTSGKLELDYSQNAADKLIVELSSQSQRSQPEKKVIQCRIYTQGKHLDLTLKASSHQTSRKDIYTGEWSWKCQQEIVSGKLNVQLLDKQSGCPQAIEIEYACPHSRYALKGQTEWKDSKLPSRAELKFTSDARVVGEIRYHQEDACTDLEIRSSEPLLKNRVCIQKSEENKLTLLSVECVHGNSKCLDLSIDLDPSQSHVANLRLKWQKEEFKQILESLKQETPALKDLIPLRQIKEELTEKCEMLLAPLKEHVLRPLSAHLVKHVRQISEEQSEEIQQVKRQIRDLAKNLPQLPTRDELKQKLERLVQWVCEDVVKYIEENAPEWFVDVVKCLWRSAERYFHQVCRRGTFCYQVKQTYQRRGMKQVQRLLKSVFDEKMEHLHKVRSQRISSVRNWIRESWEHLRRWFSDWKSAMGSLIPDWRNWGFVEKWTETIEKSRDYVENKVKEYIEKVTEYVDHVMDRAQKNEDFKALSALFHKHTAELLKPFHPQRLQKTLEAMRHTVLRKYPEDWVREKINVSEFEEGNVQIELHHPFDRVKMQLLRNVLIMAKNKCQMIRKQ